MHAKWMLIKKSGTLCTAKRWKKMQSEDTERNLLCWAISKTRMSRSVALPVAVGKVWTDVEYPDIFNCLIATLSPYTEQQLRAYKSLEAYKHFIDGWINNVSVVPISSRAGACMVTARVKHSQKLSATL